jgi:hypothetical protein
MLKNLHQSLCSRCQHRSSGSTLPHARDEQGQAEHLLRPPQIAPRMSVRPTDAPNSARERTCNFDFPSRGRWAGPGASQGRGA